MIDVSGQWNPKQALLKEILPKAEKFDEAIKLCLYMHSLVHTSETSDKSMITFEDSLWNGLNEEVFRTMPIGMNVTIAWNLWHLTRIEDLTSNILIADDIQVISRENWLKKMNTDILDTGNSMNNEEIKSLSAEINMTELRNYRVAVGRKTQEIIKSLKASDIKMKVRPERLQKILEQGGVLESSKGLLEFWGRKTIGGILQMPITRHQIVHLNDALKIKHKLNKSKSKTM